MPLKFNTLLDDAGLNLWDCALVCQRGDDLTSEAVGLGALARQPSEHKAVLRRPYWAAFIEDMDEVSFAGIYLAETLAPAGPLELNLGRRQPEFDRYRLVPFDALEPLKGRVWVEWTTAMPGVVSVEKAESGNKNITKFLPAL